eukprot:2806567-Alexandrium_andersonii.AAC.1
MNRKPALVDFSGGVVLASGIRALPEAPPANEFQSDGVAAGAVEQFKRTARAVVLAFQGQIEMAGCWRAAPRALACRARGR